MTAEPAIFRETSWTVEPSSARDIYVHCVISCLVRSCRGKSSMALAEICREHGLREVDRDIRAIRRRFFVLNL